MAEADDLEALVIPSSVKLAGGMLAGAGVCIGITGLQAFGLATSGIYSLVAPVAIMLSGGCVFAGAGIVRGRARLALAGIVLGAVTALFALAWVVTAFLHGVISFITLLAVPLSITATTLITVALKEVRRVDAARERLRAQGLDAGL
ncbi:MAG TPA: hypothetical protein VF103_07425 [Polyangiaceae bacterium]